MNLNQVTLPSKDIQESVNFYKLMGFELIVLSDSYARFESTEGDSTFSVELSENIPNLSSAVIYFEVSNLANTVKDLVGNGILFQNHPKMEPWLWEEARLLDPSGNQICLYTAGENRKNPPWRLSS